MELCDQQRTRGFDLGITITMKLVTGSYKTGGSLVCTMELMTSVVIAFGSTARACITNPDLPACRFCPVILTLVTNSSCKRLLVPLLDGTEGCQCPQLSQPLWWCTPRSSWSEFTTCSRTVGSHSSRHGNATTPR
ncbi:A disintegrin and metalloproteinase with thrombospondin motifs 13 [Lates japonicus]|uniref:A disintegrin and metalloproteinase with thrombospondin motifs 13 n=1 Tax=Lates japonicus TaxID=270547 RepID=A0AAD3MFS9_LATJO|nr:A disintegrin and metalloproteinase with thrombospondin motifs 13 [Lates japonicus]